VESVWYKKSGSLSTSVSNNSPTQIDTVAAINSRRGIVTDLIGARRALPITNEQ